jgi:hypothetical protein
VRYSRAPFIGLTAVLGIVLVASLLVLRVSGHDQEIQIVAQGRTDNALKNRVALGGLTYQAPEARPLDPGNPVDAEILRGVPAVRRPLPSGDEWYGVFLTASNPSARPLPSARQFSLLDIDGHRFPQKRGLGRNPYAYRSQAVAAGATYPPDSSAAAQNLTALGGLLLFRVPRASVDYGALELRISDHAGGVADLAVS